MRRHLNETKIQICKWMQSEKLIGTMDFGSVTQVPPHISSYSARSQPSLKLATIEKHLGQKINALWIHRYCGTVRTNLDCRCGQNASSAFLAEISVSHVKIVHLMSESFPQCATFLCLPSGDIRLLHLLLGKCSFTQPIPDQPLFNVVIGYAHQDNIILQFSSKNAFLNSRANFIWNEG
ncbi:hypothetical protein Y032_0211g2194 [Ancylostoma ceylanicum]|uniref:Uncharacterized protein n=1 Tax=Ancylostoma ceylanicum TaxID=53326 RepID=A0A016SL11_9BILA|nr:hypothetical protein Y032_0211g2194 [Ancylostoma ceylanicum]